MPEQPNPKARLVLPPTFQRHASPYPYAELDVTTNFSFLRGASHPDELVYRAAELGHTAVGVTDLNSLAGIVRAHQSAKDAGIKLCVGTRLRFDDAPDILVWVQDRSGYANLCRLLTLGKQRTTKGACLLHRNDLLAKSSGLSAALVCHSIDPEAAAPDPSALDLTAAALKETFGKNGSIAVSRGYGSLDAIRLRETIELGRKYGIPLLVTNAAHYHDEHRQPLQDVLSCIRHGCTIHDAGFRLFPNGERFIKPPQDMHRLFADLPGALRRTVQTAEQCSFSLDELCYEYPHEIVPAGHTPTSYLAELAWAGAANRFPGGVPDKVRRQIEHELAVSKELRIEAYFLTVYDLVRFARSRGILCQGRGSAANSAVCYCLGITCVDPSRIDMLFERFVSAARNEPPDIDIDFEHERREEVIQYVYEKYGRERAGMTAEVITYRGRSAVRDVGKAMGLGLDAVDALAKRIEGWSNGAPLEEQLREAGLDPADRAVRLTVALTRELLGFPRHLSQHVGGMVMTRGPLCELVPIENGAMPDRTVIEWDKDDIDALGILKVDVLGLGMLTALRKSLDLINAIHPSEPPIQLHTIPPEDPGVYAMISAADTIGVFQIESRAQMSMLPRLRPREFYDLVIEVAIVRPGPIQGQMVHPYLRRRDGIEPVSFPKPELASVLSKTLGVPLFQEQAMRIAIECAGFTPADADRLRRAVTGFRRYGDIETFSRQFIDGMAQRGYAADFAARCFEQIRGFSSYGFPESHAASFAALVYASSWIKRYHPAAFCCALLNSQPMGFYAPAQIVKDAKDHGVEVRPVAVNDSDWDCTLEHASRNAPGDCGCVTQSAMAFASRPRYSGGGLGRGSDDLSRADRRRALSLSKSPHPDPPPAYRERESATCRRLCHAPGDRSAWGHGGPAVRLGFRMIKGLSAVHAQRIVQRRREHGPFRSIDDFHAKTALPVSAVTKLADADAFASLPRTRRLALWETLALPQQRPELSMPLLDDMPAPALPLMTEGQEIHADYHTTGLSLKGHPIQLIRQELVRRKVIPAADLWKLPAGRQVSVAGLVIIRQRPGTAKGIVFETLEDETGIVNIVIFPDVYERYRSAARNAQVVQADGQIERHSQVQHIKVTRLHDLSGWLANSAFRSRDFH